MYAGWCELCAAHRDVSRSRRVKPFVKRLAAVAFFALLAGCEKFESPTAPVRLAETAAAAASDPRFALEPSAVVLRPGESQQIEVRAIWEYPLGVTFGCAGAECSIAEIRGTIPQRNSSGVITVKALEPGTARIVATIWNFGRAPGSAVVGEVHVGAAEPRRRSVRH